MNKKGFLAMNFPISVDRDTNPDIIVPIGTIPNLVDLVFQLRVLFEESVLRMLLLLVVIMRVRLLEMLF